MERSSGQSSADRYRYASALFDKGERKGAAALAAELIRDGYESAHLLMGAIYEFGGDGLKIDLQKAVQHYRLAACGVVSDIALIYLARAHMKRGSEDDLRRAKNYLMEAKKFRRSGALFLAIGAYHECQGEWSASAYNNLSALLYGRLLGMRRASDALMRMGWFPVAWLLRIVQFIAGLPLRLLLGRRSIEDF